MGRKEPLPTFTHNSKSLPPLLLNLGEHGFRGRKTGKSYQILVSMHEFKNQFVFHWLLWNKADNLFLPKYKMSHRHDADSK